MDGALSRPSGKSTRIIAAAVLLVLAVVVGVLATRKSSDSLVAPSTLTGKLAPAETAKSLAGDSVSLTSYRGRVLVVNFFASWCIPCQQEHNDLMAFSSEHKSTNDAAVVAVLFNDSTEDARAFFAQRGGDWPVMVDNGDIAIDYGVRAPPETFIIDSNGYVRQKFIGAISKSALDQTVQQLEQEAAPK